MKEGYLRHERALVCILQYLKTNSWSVCVCWDMEVCVKVAEAILVLASLEHTLETRKEISDFPMVMG